MSNLPNRGWLTHTEQCSPAADECWHMCTRLPDNFEVVSFDTRLTPARLKSQLATRGGLPPFLICFVSQGRVVTWADSVTSEQARDRHFATVRVAIETQQAAQKLAAEVGATQPKAEA